MAHSKCRRLVNVAFDLFKGLSFIKLRVGMFHRGRHNFRPVWGYLVTILVQIIIGSFVIRTLSNLNTIDQINQYTLNKQAAVQLGWFSELKQPKHRNLFPLMI